MSQYPSSAASGPVLVAIGDVSCTATQVLTPGGVFALDGTQWTIADMSQTTRERPTWAIVMAILLFLVCLLGLLFLLVKEERTNGFCQITVQSGRGLYTTHVPVSSRAQVLDLHARVNYARALSAQASL